MLRRDISKSKHNVREHKELYEFLIKTRRIEMNPTRMPFGRPSKTVPLEEAILIADEWYDEQAEAFYQYKVKKDRRGEFVRKKAERYSNEYPLFTGRVYL